MLLQFGEYMHTAFEEVSVKGPLCTSWGGAGSEGEFVSVPVLMGVTDFCLDSCLAYFPPQ